MFTNAIESRLYIYSKCEKSVISTNGLIRYINTCKIPNSLPYSQFSNPEPVLDYNTTNFLDLPLDNNEKNISSEVSINGKEKIRIVDIKNNEKDIRLADISR